MSILQLIQEGEAVFDNRFRIQADCFPNMNSPFPSEIKSHIRSLIIALLEAEVGEMRDKIEVVGHKDDEDYIPGYNAALEELIKEREEVIKKLRI